MFGSIVCCFASRKANCQGSGCDCTPTHLWSYMLSRLQLRACRCMCMPKAQEAPNSALCVFMPQLCQCGARLRSDRSCATESCPRFRCTRRGITLNKLKRPTRRLRSKQWLVSRPKGPGAGFRGLGPAEQGQDKLHGDVAAQPTPANPLQTLLRAAALEELLVGMFGLAGHFAILAVAFRLAHVMSHQHV
jgi:hypothetical protein